MTQKYKTNQNARFMNEDTYLDSHVTKRHSRLHRQRSDGGSSEFDDMPITS